jgi:hypothetical protein
MLVNPEDHRARIDALGERIAEQAAHLDAATHTLLVDIREFDEQGGYAGQGARTCAHWLSWRLGWSGGTAREHVRVASKLATLPLIDDALRRGEISYSKVRAMTRVATQLNEALLLDEARYTTGGQLERICQKYAAITRAGENDTPRDDERRRYLRKTDTADGMVRIEAVLHPEEAEVVWAAIEREAIDRCRAAQSCERAARAAQTNEPGVVTGCRRSTQQSAEQEHELERGTSSDTDAHATCTRSAQHHAPDTALSGNDPVTGCVPAETVRTNRADTSAPKTLEAARDCRTSRPAAFDRASALVSIAEAWVRGTSADRSPIELVITVPAETLRQDDTSYRDPSEVACFMDGTCISPEAARRLACDCGTVEVIEDEHGIPLSVGRRKRTIPPSMKKAMIRRDRTCRFPGCTVRVFLQGHHAKHWIDGGETSLSNGACLCDYHHRFVHEYKYTMEILPTGEVVFHDPFGRLVMIAPPPSTPANRGFSAIRVQNADLDITEATPACGWTGDPIDYGLCIEELARVDDGLMKYPVD